MNTRQTRLTLLGLAFGVLLALLISPQTRWLVRAQLFPLLLLPGHIEPQKTLFVRQHPTDFQVQLAGNPSDTSQTQLDYARSLVSRFPESMSLRANILRYATLNEVHMNRDENYIVNDQPVPVHHLDPSNPPSTPAQLAAFDADAAAGEQLDPDNAYFPFMRAVGLFAAHRDSEGLAAVQRASTKHSWREYYEDEVEGHWRINDAIYGGRETLSSLAVASAVLFPEYLHLRAAARIVLYKAILDEQAGHPEAGLAKREALARCGELMSVQSASMIGNLVGGAINAISRSRPGGVPPLNSIPNSSGDQATQERIKLYCAYVTKIGRPEVAVEAQADFQTWQQIHNLVPKSSEIILGNSMTDYVQLIAARVSGWVLLSNGVNLLWLGLAALAFGHLPQIQARRPLPAGAAWGFWSLVVISLLLISVFFNAGPLDFPIYVTLILPPLIICTVLVALFRPRLRRAVVTGLVSAGVTVGVIGLFAALTAWQMAGGNEDWASFQQTFGMSPISIDGMVPPENTIQQMQALLLSAFALVLPLLTAIILSIVSRVKRVPVSVGLVTGFRAVMPALVCGLMLVYGGLTLWTIRQEARANYNLECSLHGEGQYLAQLIGEKWPDR